MERVKQRLQCWGNRITVIWSDTDKYNRAEWIVLGLILSYCYLTMCYRDIVTTMYDAYHMWSFAFSEDIFYLTDWLSSTAYGFSFFIIFGLGELPVWIVGRFFLGRDIVTTIPALLWMKLYLLLFVLFICRELLKIAELTGIDKKRQKWLIFFYLSSLLVVLPVFHIAQYDVIGSYFTLLGVRYFLEKKDKGFFLAFAIAMPMKYFALFVFVPLVLIRFKNVFRIALSMVLGFCGVLFDKVILGRLLPMLGIAMGIGNGRVNYDRVAITQMPKLLMAGGTDEAVVEAIQSGSSVMESMGVSYLVENTIQIGEYRASVFVLVFLLICIAAYVLKRGEGEKENQRIVYFAFCGMATFFLFSYSWNSYWLVILAPYLMLVVFMKEKLLGINCILELLLSIGFVIQKMIIQFWVFGGGFTYTFLAFKYMRQRTMDTFYLLNKYHFVEFQPVIYALSVASMIGLTIINLPSFHIEERVERIRFSRTWIWARLAALLIFIGAGIDCVFFE